MGIIGIRRTPIDADWKHDSSTMEYPATGPPLLRPMGSRASAMTWTTADTTPLGRPVDRSTSNAFGVDRRSATPDVGTPVTPIADECVLYSVDADGARRPRTATGCRVCGWGRLDAREATIARMMVEGSDERQVAGELCLSTVALRAHLARICAKLDIPSTAHLRSVIGRGTRLGYSDTITDGCQRRRRPLDHRRLTQQEDAVLRLLQQGLDQRQVAAELSIGIATVGSHLAHIRAKLDDEVAVRP